MKLSSIIQRPASRIALAVIAVSIAAASWFTFRDPEIDIALTGTQRRPIVVVNGKVTQMPTGDYLAANTLVDTTACSATNVIKWDGTQFACGAGGGSGGGITNSAGNHVMTVSDGTNVIASGESDDGSVFSSSREWILGGGLHFSSGTEWTFNDSGITKTSGLTVNLTGTYTPFEKLPLMVICQTCSYDTTAQDSSMWGLNVELYPTHIGTGGHALSLMGIHVNAAITSPGGGDSSYAMYVEPSGGKIVVPDGASLGPSNFTSTANVVTTLTAGAVGTPKFTVAGATGNVTIASGGAITQHGTPTASTNIFGDLTMFGDPTITGNNAYFSSNSLNGAWDSNSNDHISINRDGYHNSNTQFRDTLLYDGKENLIAKLTGSTGEFYATTLRIGGASGPVWKSGAGAPSGACNIGDLYSNTTGSTSTTLYVCTASATWTAKGMDGNSGSWDTGGPTQWDLFSIAIGALSLLLQLRRRKRQ